MFALGVEDDVGFRNLVERCPEYVHANTAFVDFLIAHGYIQLEHESMVGGLVVYSMRNKIEHIGRSVEAGRVQSKWGTGLLYEHETLEVPSNYGDDIQFYTAMKYSKVSKAFFEFARQSGVSLVISK